jgi:hypothetical protein
MPHPMGEVDKKIVNYINPAIDFRAKKPRAEPIAPLNRVCL